MAVNYENPFGTDRERAEIWQMLVERDTGAFAEGDWSRVADDYLPETFLAIDGRSRSHPDSWRTGFANLDEYRSSWLAQSEAMRELVVELESGVYGASTLRDIEVRGDRALAHKKFDGQLNRRDGGVVQLRWQTLYQCRKVAGSWRIAGFVGYLPHPFATSEPAASAKEVPGSAGVAASGGPYSPVLTVHPGSLVVVSGQTSLAADGSVVGATVEEQTRATIANCARQLEAAGCTLRDVFKVNAYLADIGEWGAFNVVYREMVPGPFPTRTTVGVGLLAGVRVEIEMWAVKA